MATYKVEVFSKSKLIRVFHIEAYSRYAASEKIYSIARFDLKISNPEIKVHKV